MAKTLEPLDLSVELQGEDVPLTEIILPTKEQAYHRLADALVQFADLDVLMSERDPQRWQEARVVDDWLIRHKHDDRTSLNEYRWKAMELRRIYDQASLDLVETPLFTPENRQQTGLEAPISVEPIPGPVPEEIVAPEPNKSQIFALCRDLRESWVDASIQAHNPAWWQRIESLFEWLREYECDPAVELERYKLEARLFWHAYTQAKEKYSG